MVKKLLKASIFPRPLPPIGRGRFYLCAIDALIEAFKDKWNWTKLSSNSDLELSHELLEKYSDEWDRAEI